MKPIHDLDLLEKTEIDGNIYVLRVPGGWIFRTPVDNTFVPWHIEGTNQFPTRKDNETVETAEARLKRIVEAMKKSPIVPSEETPRERERITFKERLQGKLSENWNKPHAFVAQDTTDKYCDLCGYNRSHFLHKGGQE